MSADTDLLLYLVRSAFLGLSASCVSDVVSNSLRVLKTTKQTSQLSADGEDLSYPEIVKAIIAEDGVVGLFGRGLQTRLLTNAIQGAVFMARNCHSKNQSVGPRLDIGARAHILIFTVTIILLRQDILQISMVKSNKDYLELTIT